MTHNAELEILVERIMKIEVMRMGGASSAILGTYGADHDIVYRLKKNTLAFARECRKPAVERPVLEELANEIDGDLRILQLSHTISDTKAAEIIGLIQTALQAATD